MEPVNVNPEPSSTGLDPKVAGLLCYLLTFITGIIFLVIEKQSRSVKFHATQSTITFAILFAASLIARFIPFIGGLIGVLISLLTFVLWIALMLLALQGKQYKLPIIGDFVEAQSRKF
ncbi:DUF4870 domain-containing protein [Paenibacillus sp. HB172176]|uniref:DUF4870 domain-containing protein n=1 Tax=Paenibacillus sp. HB172176 TaxID=2493690 RepID=UPI00143986D9|nr:DUF4870 domain-containing protein [Paenibacillus sp. HB172176]